MTCHLVILKHCYLSAILAGRKTVECRLSRTRRAPYAVVRPGDRLWLKRSGGPVVAVAQAGWVEAFHPVTPALIRQIEQRYAAAALADADFFRHHQDARFATVLAVEAVQPVEPIRIAKRDQRAWVVLPGPLLTTTRQPGLLPDQQPR